MKTLFHILIIAGMALMAGCGEEKEQFARYPSVGIPEYTCDDYVRQLSDTDPEIVYNAICNLGISAREMGNALWGDKANPESDEWKSAMHVYTNVCLQLEKDDPMAIAASLRYLQLFAGSHASRSELMEPVVQLESAHPLVQFEQVELLLRLIDENTSVPEPVLRRLINSKSWIVSRSAYGLVGRQSDESLRAELLHRYHSSNDETERLIVLASLEEGTTPDELEFMMNEMMETESSGIRKRAFYSILNNASDPVVEAWLGAHLSEFGKEEQGLVFGVAEEMDDAEAGFRLMEKLLAQGYEPDDSFLQDILDVETAIAEASSEDLAGEDLAEAKNMLAKLDRLIAGNPPLAKRMADLRESEALRRTRYEALQAEIEPLKSELVQKLEKVLSEHEIPEDEQEKFLKAVVGLDAESVIRATWP